MPDTIVREQLDQAVHVDRHRPCTSATRIHCPCGCGSSKTVSRCQRWASTQVDVICEAAHTHQCNLCQPCLDVLTRGWMSCGVPGCLERVTRLVTRPIEVDRS